MPIANGARTFHTGAPIQAALLQSEALKCRVNNSEGPVYKVCMAPLITRVEQCGYEQKRWVSGDSATSSNTRQALL